MRPVRQRTLEEFAFILGTHDHRWHRRLNDLRDTYASQLPTRGVDVAFVSRQLGHATIEVTLRHCAQWCAGDDYLEPLRPAPGEVPADMLARIAPSLARGLGTSVARRIGVPANVARLQDFVEPTAGVEPATYALRMRCSTS